MKYDKEIERYIAFVEDATSRYKSIGDVTFNSQEISPPKLYKALADYYPVSSMLNAEYQRVKIEKLALELEFEERRSEWFAIARSALVSETTSKAKPALTEVEMRMESMYQVEYFEFKARLMEAESRCDFYVRMRETLNKYDSVLTTLAYAMRSEMKALSLESRAETDPATIPTR
jgi:hypothetical protein